MARRSLRLWRPRWYALTDSGLACGETRTIPYADLVGITSRLAHRRRPGAILFSIIHVSVFSGIYLFALGLVLGVLRHRSRSLVPGIMLHFFHNFSILAVEYYSLWTSPGNS